MKIASTFLGNLVDSINTPIINPSEYEDSYFDVNIDDILIKHENWLFNLPRVRPYYAVKCNDAPIVLQILVGLGVGFNCASKGEIETILSLNVSPSRIFYTNPCKTRSFIRHALTNGVDLMTFDSEDELYKIASIYPSARLMIRMKVDGSCQFSSKFGVDIDKCSYLLSIAQSLSLKVVGLSFHVGSSYKDAEIYSKAINDAACVFKIAKDMDIYMNILDIGGGFPGSANSLISFEEVACAINNSLNTHFPQDDISIIAGPGRYYVTSAFTLSSSVVDKEIRLGVDDIPQALYYLNDGIFRSFNCMIYDNFQPCPTPNPKNKHKRRDMLITTLLGPTLDSMDMIKKDFFFPEIDIGDRITFADMGAYTIASSNDIDFTMPNLNYQMSSSALRALKNLGTWKDLSQLVGAHEEDEIIKDETQ